MTGHQDDAPARSVLAAMDMADADLSPLGTGFASEAWRVGRSGSWFALRIARDGVTHPTYEREHALMGRLAASGARVPLPVRGSWEIDGWQGPSFSLTTGLEGSPLAVDAYPRAVPALATFLRLLHGQTLDGFGTLSVDGGLHGEQSTMAEGLIAWAGRPIWPLGEARLDDHSALAHRDALRARLDAQAPAVRLALDRGPAVLLHSDLHEENILDANGALGVIDFGEAFIGPAAWEFAALGYFMDWPTADAALAAYAHDASERARLHADATAIALCFGVYRWAQDRRLNLDEDAYNEAFLLQTLARM